MSFCLIYFRLYFTGERIMKKISYFNAKPFSTRSQYNADTVFSQNRMLSENEHSPNPLVFFQKNDSSAQRSYSSLSFIKIKRKKYAKQTISVLI